QEVDSGAHDVKAGKQGDSELTVHVTDNMCWETCILLIA
ncbi:hypothetical protein Tco_1340785, partial [Tanacetum coccineum]